MQSTEYAASFCVKEVTCELHTFIWFKASLNIAPMFQQLRHFEKLAEAPGAAETVVFFLLLLKQGHKGLGMGGAGILSSDLVFIFLIQSGGSLGTKLDFCYIPF